jgi:hypothetical protein
MTFTFQGRSSVSWRWRTFSATKHQQYNKIMTKFENSSMKTVSEQFVRSQTLLGSDNGVCQ